MTRDIKGASTVSEMSNCQIALNNNITSQYELQSDELTLPFFIVVVPHFFLVLAFFGSVHKH